MDLFGEGVNAATATPLAGKQPLDSDLTAIAALTTTAYGRALLSLADAAAGRTALEAEVSGAAAAAQAAAIAASQPLDADLTAIAALTTTAFGRGLLALADAAALRASTAQPFAVSGWYDGTGNNRNFFRRLISDQTTGLFFPFALELVGFSVSSNTARTSGSTAVAAVVNGSVSGTAVATYNSGRSASWTGSLSVPAMQEFTFNQVTSSHLPASQLEVVGMFVRA